MEGDLVKFLHRIWPRGWWPDQRTLGLLIFGFFGVSAMPALWFSAYELSQLLNLQTPNEISIVPTWARLSSGGALLGGVAALVAAFGGLALMADLPRARAVTASAVAISGAAMLTTLVAS